MVLSLLTALTAVTNAAELVEVLLTGQLKKTREHTILSIIGYNRGDEIESSDREIIQQNLIKSGLFIAEDIIVSLDITESVPAEPGVH